MATSIAVVTADELLKMQSGVERFELIEGVPVRMSPTGYEHGEIVMRLGRHLGNYLDENEVGSVSSEVGFRLESDPDTVLAPDIAILSAESAVSARKTRGFPQVVPLIAFEIVSPDDTAEELDQKVEIYFRQGVASVVAVWPRTRSATVWNSDGSSERIPSTETLALPHLLPGFSILLSKLFAQES